MRIGDMLVAAGIATDDQIQQALGRQKETGRRLGEELVDLGFVTEAQLTQALSNQLSIPWVSLYHVEFSRELLNLVPAELAEQYGLIPVYVRQVRRQGDTLFVAMDDPTNADVLAHLRQVTGMPVKPMVAAPSDIRNAIRVYYFGVQPRPPSAAPRRAIRSEGPPPEVLAASPPEHVAEPSPTAAAPRASAARESAPPPAQPAQATEAPQPNEAPAAKPSQPAKQPRMITLTLLDGTTVRLPAPNQKKRALEADAPSAEPDESGSLTAYDLVAALAGRAQGADVSDVLPDDRWEPLFAALLSVLLRKGLVADWEFVEEWRKRQG
jgi:type IV pilus assembly protein PilB